MSEKPLPLELDVDSVTIQQAGRGWEYILERSHAEDIILYEEMPDPTYEQLVDAEDIVYDEQRDVMVRGPRHADGDNE